MITQEDFSNVLLGLSRLIPQYKALDAMALGLAWMTFPPKAKEELTLEMWVYAAGQRRLDPNPPEDVPLDLQLLNYVFRNENGRANVAWGLKADLPERMQRSHVFNPQPVAGQVIAPAEEPITNPLLMGVRW